MNFLLDIFNRLRPHFGKKGRFSVLFPLFDTVEHVFFYPATRTKASPHIRDALDIKRYMGIVILAMLPCVASSIYFYGPYIIAMIIVSYAVGGICEVAFAIIRKGEIHEGFFVTGLIFPLILPPTTPLWMVGVGVLFGVFFGKEVFGGTGRNVFNPALVGRIFVTIAFPVQMTTRWKTPSDIFGIFKALGLEHAATDAITAATPMSIAKTQQVLTSYGDLLWGNTGGSIGETFHLGIIIGGIFLMLTKVANWRIPVSYLVSVAIFSWIGHGMSPDKVYPPLFQLLSGGLLFGAMFMATDPVTSPFTKIGKWIFGILCGLLTVLIRSFSGYVEGVMFSIVIVNAFVPLIDHIVLMAKFREKAA
jgi:Na+-transporting NADH:ubiquinone oxidoreductase subunit B/electron transport complex protein RnfD